MTDWQRYDLPDQIRYCSRCVMPNTRPGLTIDDEGVCSACRAHEARASVDWSARWGELRELCDRHRRTDGRADCIITVSSGKDSFHQVATMVEKLGMHPLLLNVGNWRDTDTGRRNAELMSRLWGCEMLSLKLPEAVARPMLRKALDKLLAPTWYWDAAVYAWPPKMAIAMGIPLVIYGEDISHQYGGASGEEKASALDQWSNGVVTSVDAMEWLGDGVEPWHLANAIVPPTRGEMEAAGLEPVYLSYFEPWSGFANMEQAKARGWLDLADSGEWIREGLAEQFDQIDARGYNVHPWLKFPKFGHHHMTDVLSMWIREGRISRGYAAELVIDEEWKLDPVMLRDFLGFAGIEETIFWDRVHQWANRRMLESDSGAWRLTDAACNALVDGGAMCEGGRCGL